MPLARAYGVDLRELLSARTLEEQRAFFETTLAPLFDKPRGALGHRQPAVALRPRHSAGAIRGAGRRHATCATCCATRLERLACGFSLDDNYFAWQAFGRSYADDAARPAAALSASASISTRFARAPIGSRC